MWYISDILLACTCLPFPCSFPFKSKNPTFYLGFKWLREQSHEYKCWHSATYFSYQVTYIIARIISIQLHGNSRGHPQGAQCQLSSACHCWQTSLYSVHQDLWWTVATNCWGTAMFLPLWLFLQWTFAHIWCFSTRSSSDDQHTHPQCHKNACPAIWCAMYRIHCHSEKYEVAYKKEYTALVCFNEILWYSQFHKENNKNVFGIYSDSIIVIPTDNNHNVFCFSTFMVLLFFFFFCNDLFVMTYSMCDRCPMLAAKK